jgi:hypothetical protein
MRAIETFNETRFAYFDVSLVQSQAANLLKNSQFPGLEKSSVESPPRYQSGLLEFTAQAAGS